MNILQLQRNHPASHTSKLFIDSLETAVIDNQAFIKTIQERLFPTIGLLPPLVRWMSPTGRFVLFERPPQIQEIAYTPARKNEILTFGENYRKPQIFSIPLPWMLYGFEFGYDYYPMSMYAYALRKPISDPNNILGILPLPNFYSNGSMCIPPREALEPTSIGEGINIAYNSIWDAGFNNDLPQSFNSCRHRCKPLSLFIPKPTLDDSAVNTLRKSRMVSPPKLLGSWERKTLPEVVGITDWQSPVGVMDEDTQQPAPKTVQALINYFTLRESLVQYMDPATNIKLTIYQCCMQAKV